ncbi:MAG: tRNA 2-thiouridine(34) synthase MnmA [Flavobacteriales bacterium]|nr:tRNA 2-thiouridine(34) synthase MnmA [Flavobacteriales bacterium]|tara:strand:+ start:2121 stop:3293 length:1173 start_codon:yes stop_codon:yes gene_type:complete
MERVIVGLSGGVDSSVAAYLLKKNGYEVIGIFMKNWHDSSITISDNCPWIDDRNDAMIVAEKLGIPFHTLDFSKEYKTKIVDYMHSEYKRGRTPNPDILCNKEIKFDLFLKAALNLNAEYIATGHYCKKEEIKIDGNLIYRLLIGKDKIKDQSYFLSQLNQFQLSKIKFPIGDLKKSEVRQIARKINLINAEKKDSQGLCFIGKVKLPEFLKKKLNPIRGKVIKVDKSAEIFNNLKNKKKLEELVKEYNYSNCKGKVIGEHNGAHFYTIGQRKGINIGGFIKPLYVIFTDTLKNIIYVGEGENHPGLYRKGLKVIKSDIHWIREDLKIKFNQNLKVESRIRHRQKLQKSTLYMKENELIVIFNDPQKAIASGQFIAWYVNNELIGSGKIF